MSGRPSPLVLGIETSCDDTACALMDGEGRVLASVVSSQPAVHQPYGGVVPEIASREHLVNWPQVSARAFATAGASMGDVEVIAATRGPGLVGSLLVGLSLGKSLAYALGRPFHAVHHLEGHLVSPFLRAPGEPAEPVPERFVGLVLSGGHSTLFAVDGGAVATLGETRDDAMGEVFDKVGKRLGLPYPQGPRVDELAERGNAAAFRLPVPGCGETLDFSFSGLKSQALLAIERLEARLGPLDISGTASGKASGEASGKASGEAGSEMGIGAGDGAAGPVEGVEGVEGGSGDGGGGAAASGDRPGSPPQAVLDLLAGFRAAAVAQVLDRLERLLARGPIGVLAVSGGAAANRLLRRELPAWAARHGIDLRLVPLAYAGDNAAMIAHAALLRHRRGLADDPFAAEAESRIPV